MSPTHFRELALSLPEATEASHMAHPDFRVRDKIFATLAADETWAMAKLTPEQQTLFVKTAPLVFEPFPGGWGARGATKILLATATEPEVLQALTAAWRNVAPKKLL
ncbi:MmcQ/YjbR family DNA-binding protein [soil metagenome]